MHTRRSPCDPPVQPSDSIGLLAGPNHTPFWADMADTRLDTQRRGTEFSQQQTVRVTHFSLPNHKSQRAAEAEHARVKVKRDLYRGVAEAESWRTQRDHGSKAWSTNKDVGLRRAYVRSLLDLRLVDLRTTVHEARGRVMVPVLARCSTATFRLACLYARHHLWQFHVQRRSTCVRPLWRPLGKAKGLAAAHWSY